MAEVSPRFCLLPFYIRLILVAEKLLPALCYYRSVLKRNGASPQGTTADTVHCI
jgi:hypothetical protein